MNLKVFYGVEKAYMDVTNRALMYNFMFNKTQKGKLCLPTHDGERNNVFNDHLEGILKHIIIEYKHQNHRFDSGQTIEFNLDPTDVSELENESVKILSQANPEDKLLMIHRNVRFMYGRINDELPEQVMASTFIQPDNVVLELGANVGRNTIVISCLLRDSQQLVTLETDKNTCKQLGNNRDLNELEFNIENSALSTRFLLQKENSWDTEVRDTDEVPQGYNRVNTITFTDLKRKYNRVFDTLVADCEGSLYYIFQDFPDILEKDINTIIMENDYHNASHKIAVNEFLTKNGFTCVYRKAGGWGPCYGCFFETLKRV